MNEFMQIAALGSVLIILGVLIKNSFKLRKNARGNNTILPANEADPH